MKSFGEHLRKAREDQEFSLRKVAAALDIDTLIFRLNVMKLDSIEEVRIIKEALK